MKYDDSFYRMLKNIERQSASLRDLERLCSPALKDAAQILMEREMLLRNLVPEMEQRYKSLAEVASNQAATNLQAEMLNATSIVSKMLNEREYMTGIAQEAIAASKYWQTELDFYKSLSAETEACRLALTSHYSNVAELSLIAQERVQQFNINARAEIGTSQSLSMAVSSFSKLIKKYDHLFESFEKAECKIASFPPFVSLLPPVEIITGSDFLATIYERKRPLSQQRIKEGQTQIAQEIETSLENLLDKLDPDLIRIWQGAKAALKSNNPDRPRHIIVSLRELVNYVLHQTAPDDRIRSWTANPSFFDKGHPTRRARLHFICRDLNQKPFEKFVAQDISFHLELIQILQRGTHELCMDLTEEQLSALILKTESLIRFILVIWSSNN